MDPGCFVLLQSGFLQKRERPVVSLPCVCSTSLSPCFMLGSVSDATPGKSCTNVNGAKIYVSERHDVLLRKCAVFSLGFSPALFSKRPSSDATLLWHV